MEELERLIKMYLNQSCVLFIIFMCLVQISSPADPGSKFMVINFYSYLKFLLNLSNVFFFQNKLD